MYLLALLPVMKQKKVPFQAQGETIYFFPKMTFIMSSK